MALGNKANCFGWPDVNFGPDNMVDICSPGPECGDAGLGLKTGDRAADFTLLTADGDEVSLGARLAERPVFLEFGSFT